MLLMYVFTVIFAYLYLFSEFLEYSNIFMIPTLFCVLLIFLEKRIFNNWVLNSKDLLINKKIIMDTLKVIFIIFFVALVTSYIIGLKLKLNSKLINLPYFTYIFLLSFQEEFIFRGYIDKKLINILKSKYIYIISYLLWALSHVPKMFYDSNILYFDLLTFIGVCYKAVTTFIFSYVVIRYLIRKNESLISPLLYHFINNLVASWIVIV